MIQNCEQCGLEYDAKRSTSKYCGNKCRKLAFQSVSVPVFDENANLIATVEHNGEIVAHDSHTGSLATLSLQYDIIRGSDKAKEHAKRVMEGGAWC